MKTTCSEAAKPIRGRIATLLRKLTSESTASKGILLGTLAIFSFSILGGSPLFGQYTGKNVSVPGTLSSGLTSTSSGLSTGGNGHALVYDSNLNQTTDLNPAGAVSSVAKATDGIEEVGYQRSSVYYYDNCTLWKGSAASAVMMTPPTYAGSWCVGTDGGREIGWGFKPFYIYSIEHAILWSGSANSYVDLHAGGATYSRGRGIRGGEQVGEIDQYATTDPDSGSASPYSRAVLWHDTAASMVILHPAGYISSGAVATNGTQEGGWASPTGSGIHAILWSGTAASAVDLHPTGYFDTRLTALSANSQVGDGWVGGAAHTLGAHRHALAWGGSAQSVVDLHIYAPTGYSDSVATGVDASGNVVGYAFNVATMGDHLPIDAISVIFAAAAPPATPISSISLSALGANPGDTLRGLVTLTVPAPAGGVSVSFQSGNAALIPAPADVLILEGQSTASFVAPVNMLPISAVTPVTLIGITGSVRKAVSVTVSPVIQLSSLAVNPVQGGSQTLGTVNLNLPAISPVTVLLTSDNAAVAVPASVTIAVGRISQTFPITASIVSAATSGTITASFNGVAVNATENVSPTMPLVVSSVTVPPVLGGNSFGGTVTLNHAAYLGGVTVSLASANAALVSVPATITIPYGAISRVFSGTAGSVIADTSVAITASLNGASVSGNVVVSNGPGATIQSLDYWSISHLIKVTATTTKPSGTLTFGVNPNGPAMGVLAIEPTTGLYQGSVSMSSAPAIIYVWNSAGGSTVSSTLIRIRSK